MKDADDLLAFAAPERQPGVRALERGIHHLIGGQVDVDRVHLGPVHHDVGDGELAEIEHAAQHVAVELHHAAFLVVQVNGAAQLLMGGQDLEVVADRDAEQPQSVARTRNCMAAVTGASTATTKRTRGSNSKSHAVGVDDGVGLGQHLGEQHDEHRHQHRGVGDAGVAEQGQEQAGGKRRGGDVGEAVAEQDGADQSLADRRAGG